MCALRLDAASGDDLGPASTTLAEAARSVAGIVLGKTHAIRLALACIAARGHLLIEDIPGVGKTTLAQALARSLGLDYQRIQFTSDLLPADIVGTTVYDRERATFEFHPGPIFSHLILADEVNRATPRAQSALLEAMEERQVTVDRNTHPLPRPFFVVATQNPSRQVGTFPLPESQLDRFLMRIHLGYPDTAAEHALLCGEDRRALIGSLQPVTDAAGLERVQRAVEQVHASDALVAYVQAIVAYTRNSGRFECGLSPRGGLALLRAARAWALVDGRDLVLPEDVQQVAGGVVSHRLGNTGNGDDAEAVEQLVREVPLP